MTDVYFCTNRNASPQNNPKRFGSEFSKSGMADLRFGVAKVNGKKVSVQTHGESLKQAKGKNETDDSKSKFGSKVLLNDLRAKMKNEKSDTIVFIHGYNVSFKEAMQSAAQVAENFDKLNSGRTVNIITFSWPSDGSMMPWIAYSNDRSDAAASGAAVARAILKLRDFLYGLSKAEACDQKIHLIAHSMGNFVLRNALQEIRSQSASGIPRIFDQIFLMAADEDDNAFEHDFKLKLLPRLGRRVNVYFNRGDRAMSISDRTKGNPDRLGDDGPRAPFQVPAKVTQVDCTPVVGGIVEHSYYVDEPKVVEDMAQVMAGFDPMAVSGRKFLADRNRFVILGD
ncbi:MAG: esterase/lipase superfamily enzyme [Planctomycetota bacterium]|jgi:esterase/lipase superfamily enzyme